MVLFYKIWKQKYYEIQSTKNRMGLNNRKRTNHPPSPEPCGLFDYNYIFTFTRIRYIAYYLTAFQRRVRDTTLCY